MARCRRRGIRMALSRIEVFSDYESLPSTACYSCWGTQLPVNAILQGTSGCTARRGGKQRAAGGRNVMTSGLPVTHSSGVAILGNMPVRCKGPIPRCAFPMRSANVTLRLDLLASEVATLWAFRRRGPSLCFGKPNPAATDIDLAERYFPAKLFSAGQRSQPRSVHRRGRDIR